MRMLLHAKIPHEQFNAAVRDGTAGQKLNNILEETKPEVVYFTEYDGRRVRDRWKRPVEHVLNPGGLI